VIDGEDRRGAKRYKRRFSFCGDVLRAIDRKSVIQSPSSSVCPVRLGGFFREASSTSWLLRGVAILLPRNHPRGGASLFDLVANPTACALSQSGNRRCEDFPAGPVVVTAKTNQLAALFILWIET